MTATMVDPQAVDDYVYCLNTKVVHDGSTTMDELLDSIDNFRHLIATLSVDHELSDSVDGGWVPVKRKDGAKIDIASAVS